MSAPTAETFAEFYRQLVDLFVRLNITDFAFTGGLAYSVWVEPRATRDVDLCAVVPLESVDKLLAWKDGIRSGPEPLPMLLRFSLASWDVDLFTVADPYYRECMRRCVTGHFAGTEIRIVSREDLLVHKIFKLRSDKRDLLLDASDVRNVVRVHEGELDFGYIATWCGEKESRLLEKAAAMSEVELVTALGSV